MTWIWALAGGLVGLLLSKPLVGFVFGVLVTVLMVHQRRLSRRLEDMEQELSALRRGSVVATETPSTETVVEAPTDSPPPLNTAATAATAATAQPVVPQRRTAPPSPQPPPLPSSPPTPPSTPQTPPPQAPPYPSPPPPTMPAPQQGPGTFDQAVAALKAWFKEGNVPVKIGILVLFAGVAAALRFAAAEGYFTLPVGWRLSLIALGALAGLGWGWRERQRRPAFGLSLQGGAIGVLLLTVFAAYRLYDLLPSSLAFAMVVILVGGAALLASLQRAMTLATLGFLGGYLAPVLLSTGSGNHVALFSYYAVLNGAVFAISWRHQWRLLNLIGFAFTFGVGSIWFARSYRPELFWTVEPFLILFFLFYVAIGLLYATRQGNGRRPWLDGTLVFGTPLVTFPMQAVLLKDDSMALAFSALAVSGIYAAMLYGLRRYRNERLLTDAYGALALGFATLAVPLAFSAGTTTGLWALEGVAVAWMGLRQERTLPWLSGLALQLFAAVAFLISEGTRNASPEWLLLNGTWLGAAMLGFSGVALALIFDRHKPIRALPALLMIWGLGWWTCAGLSQLDQAGLVFSHAAAEWQFGMLYLTASLLLTGALRRWLQLRRLGWGMVWWALLTFLCALWAHDELDHVVSSATLPAWLAYLVAWWVVLWLHRKTPGLTVGLTQTLGFWTAVLAASLHIHGTFAAPSGWRFLATVAPLGLLTLGLWQRPRWFAWPRADAFEKEHSLWFGPALPLLTFIWWSGLFQRGAADPLPYVPLLNPLELALLAMAVLLGSYCRARLPRIAAHIPLLWAGAGFAFLTLGTLRAVHHLHGDPWTPRILDVGLAQTSLTVVWSLLGVTAWIAGSRFGRRALWLAGAGLMGLVLLKLMLVDRQYMGNIPGIVSFLAVGLLLVVVGYFAPSPTQTRSEESS